MIPASRRCRHGRRQDSSAGPAAARIAVVARDEMKKSGLISATWKMMTEDSTLWT